nr:hypothetical protein [Saccharopolyspora erythraea]
MNSPKGSRAAAACRAPAAQAEPQPTATTAVPATEAEVGCCVPSTTATANPDTGIRPISTPTRSAPRTASPWYQRQNATAVTTTATTSSAASSTAPGGRSGSVAAPAARPIPPAMRQHHIDTASPPSRATTPTASSVNDASHSRLPTESARPAPRHAPPPESAAMPATTSAAPATTGGDGRRRDSSGAGQAEQERAGADDRGHETRVGVALGVDLQQREPEHPRDGQPGERGQVAHPRHR